MKRIDQLAHGDAIIYIAGRLFSIDDKMRSEILEESVLGGVYDAAAACGASVQRSVTYVPFRDADQENLVTEDKARKLFQMDLERLQRTTLLVSYIDGLAKDEGVCFEIGYAFVAGAAILLVSTDFFDIELPNGASAPLDPLLCATATALIHRPRLAELSGTFRDVLAASTAVVLADVRTGVRDLLGYRTTTPLAAGPRDQSGGHVEVLVDFGGNVYEWQALLQDELARNVVSSNRLHLARTRRYDVNLESPTAEHAGAHDLAALAQADLLVSCVDGDEAPAGTALLQGAMCALGRPIWMYNSKRTAITAAGGYRMSRNLMLDYSATRTFQTVQELAVALNGL